MRRILIAGFLAIVLWFGLKDWAFRTLISQGEHAAQPDYAVASAWAERPETPPPGGWASPWGVDVFLIPPPRTAPAKVGPVAIDHAASNAQTRDLLDELEPVFGKTMIYAPLYRHASPAIRRSRMARFNEMAKMDIEAAFARYLAEDNRHRAFMIAAPDGMGFALDGLLTEIRADADLLERFGGVIRLAQPGAEPDDALSRLVCSPAFERSCLAEIALPARRNPFGLILPNLPAPVARHELADPDAAKAAIASLAENLSDWLDENANKPAEPMDGLDSMETVEIAPVRRPGEVDAGAGGDGD